MPLQQHTKPEGLNYERVQIAGPICKKRALTCGLLWCNQGPLELTRQIDYAIIKQHDRVRREALMPPSFEAPPSSEGKEAKAEHLS